MLIVDLIIVATVVLAGVWGRRGGLAPAAIALVGFGGGAVLGSRIAPLILDGGVHSPAAPILALPGALLFGGLLATAMEAIASRSAARRRRRRSEVPALLDGVGGPLLGACAALFAVWLLSAALVRADALRDPLRESSIVRLLNDALPPPGPLLRAEAVGARDALPRLHGPRPRPRLRPASRAILADPQVRAAARSVVKLTGVACGRLVVGSGWIAPGGIVVTNAHVIAGQDDTTAQVGGKGAALPATAIWIDRRTDIALLRVPRLPAPALRMVRRATPGTAGAVLGFPRGGPYSAGPARVGPTYAFSRASRLLGRGRQVRVPATTLLGDVRDGHSGGPVVDDRGRVLTTIFAAAVTGLTAYGVPVSAVREALRRAGPAVDTGGCAE
jgi:S1-C subfamily serine protease